jgi:hypothetical protein
MKLLQISTRNLIFYFEIIFIFIFFLFLLVLALISLTVTLNIDGSTQHRSTNDQKVSSVDFNFNFTKIKIIDPPILISLIVIATLWLITILSCVIYCTKTYCSCLNRDLKMVDERKIEDNPIQMEQINQNAKTPSVKAKNSIS